jgi:predicted metal-dependent hydrolase
VPLLMVRHRRARRYLLRLGPDGRARVTIPPRGTVEGARAFAERNRAWLAAQLDRLPSCAGASAAWRAGDQIWFRGERLPLETLSSGEVRWGTERLAVPAAQGNLRPVVEWHLQWLAKQELPGLVARLAGQHGFGGDVKRVTVRNQKTRWGSCSSCGTISLNWRLIQTPDFVRDYIILHELAHLRHMNHSVRFWQEVKRLCPDHARAEQWLKDHRQMLQ